MTTADIVIPKSGTDIKFSYLIPEELEPEAKIGKPVLVSLKNRTVYGFIYNINNIIDSPDITFGNKKITEFNIRSAFGDNYIGCSHRFIL